MNITWRAHYRDGSVLEQGNGATYRDIDRTNLAAFGLYEGERPLVMVDFDEDGFGDPALGPKRLIWRRRGMVQAGVNSASIHVHLVGWQRQVNGTNVQSICYVNEETGAVVLGGQWIDNRPFMHPVILQPQEK